MNEDYVFKDWPLALTPRQPVVLSPQRVIFGVQVNRNQANQQPINIPATLISTQRIKDFNTGNFKYFLQSFRPMATVGVNVGTTIYVSSNNGTQNVASNTTQGPAVFVTSPSTAPTSVNVQTNTSLASSNPGLGTGNSKAFL